MKHIDFEKHNEEVRKLWDDFYKGKSTRVPVTFSMNERMILLDPKLNPEKITAKDFFENPDIMLDIQLKFQKWLRYNIPQDAEMGLPKEWPIKVTFFNSYEAGWFGCPINYREGELPDTSPILKEKKEKLYDMEIPDPIHNHKKIVAEFSKGGPNSIHLCGKVSHLLPIIQKELNVQTFDLGFPTDLGVMRKILGKDVLLIGNIHPGLLRDGPKEKIEEAVKKLCTSGVMDGKKFILHDGNNCTPCTPISHFEAMYEAGKRSGRYD